MGLARKFKQIAMASSRAIAWKPLGSGEPCRAAARSWLLVVGLLATTVDALRMINLDAPETAFQGETIQLTCSFELRSPRGPVHSYLAERSKSTPGGERVAAAVNKQSPDLVFLEDQHDQTDWPAGDTGEVLYAVKWYKDGREFFRFLSKESPRKQVLPMDGLLVDMEKSDNNTVVLRNISLKTSGRFKCEVSTDAPHFVTKSIERPMFVYGPRIEQRKPGADSHVRLFLADQLDLTCTAPESKPAATIDWIINDSLNLTASPHLKFQVSRRRLVKLPALNGSPLLPRGQSVGLMTKFTLGKQQQIGSGLPSYLTYEVRPDGSLAEIDGGDPSRPSIEPHQVVMDRLLESSQTNLKLTIDADLLGLLLGQHRSAKTPETFHPLGFPGESSIGRFVSLKSRPIQVIDDTSSSTTTGPTNSTYFGSTAGKKSQAKSSVSQPLGNIGSTSSAKQFPFTLKVKCVARVLHLSMSDDLKLRIYNQTRVVADNQQQSDHRAKSQPRQRSSSAGLSSSPVKLGMLTVCLIGGLIANILSS